MVVEEARDAERSTRVRRFAFWVLAVPTAMLALLAVFGALHGAFEEDCQVGFYTACGPEMKALAYAAFLGIPLLIAYYVTLGIVAGIRLVASLVDVSDE